MHIFILRKKRFSPFQDVYKEQIYILTRIGSNIENTEILREMAIYTVDTARTAKTGAHQTGM